MKKIFAIIILTLPLHLPLLANASERNYFPIKIVNHSKIATGNEVYVFIKAKISTENGDHACAFSFDSKGYGTCNLVGKSTDLSQYNYSLSKLPIANNGTGYQIYLPKAFSGRMYFSIGKPMFFMTDTRNPGAITMPDPDGFKTRDPNYYTLYDKIEFSYTSAGTWINPTAVDFFSIPIGINQPTSTTGITQSGFSSSTRQQIFKHIESIFAVAKQSSPSTIHDWNHLLLNYTGLLTDGDSGTTTLRLMAPGKAMTAPSPLSKNIPFDPKYLQNSKLGFQYIPMVWKYYQSHTLTIDASELKNNPAAPKLTNYLFTGSVDTNNNFVFTNATREYSVKITMPQSISFFAGAQGSFDAKNNTPKAIIVRQLTSAFEAGLLPAPNGITLNKNFFSKYKSKFYTENTLLNAGKTGPWYDLYSKALHSIGAEQPIYTFAYDDALGQDGTLHDPNAGLATITIGDMTGTRIPAAIKSNSTYTVSITIGMNALKRYYPLKIFGKIITPSSKTTTFRDVKDPLTVEFNNQAYQISLTHPMVRPATQITSSIVIGNSDKTHVNITFPGPPN